jgi:hypothetical protein
MSTSNRWVRRAAIGALLPLAACGDILNVEAPGRIADESLNDLQAFPALVAGMSFDLTEAYDATVLYTLPIASGELWHSGSYSITEEARGVLKPEDMNDEWEEIQQARFVAEAGIERMREVFESAGQANRFATSPLVAQAYLYAGLANRLAGENFCSTAIDGGEEQPHAVHFSRAQEQFTRAIEIGEMSGKAGSVVDAAFAGRASVRAWQGDWAGAVQDAQRVPVDHRFDVVFNTENANDLWVETHQRPEFTVWNTPLQAHPDDPRAPWTVVLLANGDTATGANGSTPFFRQLKFPETGADVAATKGTEMLVLRAEAALRNNDIAGAFDLLNQARAFYKMEPLDAPASLEAAWDVLQHERLATLWLEGRHFWDVRRFFEAGPGSPMFNPFLEGRDKCIPISEEERKSNPNLQG